MASTTPLKTQGYDVARPLGRCAVSGEPIVPGEKYMAALRETATGFERVDVSLAHWAEFDRHDVIGDWQTTMPQPEQKRKLFVDDDVLCTLLERLADTTEANKLNFRFVLGLILMRKRLLVYESSQLDSDGREMWTVRFRGREEKLQLLNPRLDEEQVMAVSQQLGEILNEEL